MTNREKVLARYPGAFCEHDLIDTANPQCKWYVYESLEGRCLGVAHGSEAAWALAANRIEQEHKA